MPYPMTPGSIEERWKNSIDARIRILSGGLMPFASYDVNINKEHSEETTYTLRGTLLLLAYYDTQPQINFGQMFRSVLRGSITLNEEEFFAFMNNSNQSTLG